jgi:hypothetical protein
MQNVRSREDFHQKRSCATLRSSGRTRSTTPKITPDAQLRRPKLNSMRTHLPVVKGRFLRTRTTAKLATSRERVMHKVH